MAKASVGDCWLYVIPAPITGVESEWATNGQDESGVDQEITVQFQVWFFIRNVSQTLGAGADDKLWPIRKECLDALLGWVPNGCEAPIQFARGAPQGFTETVSAYADTFQTTTRYIAVNTFSN